MLCLHPMYTHDPEITIIFIIVALYSSIKKYNLLKIVITLRNSEYLVSEKKVFFAPLRCQNELRLVFSLIF